MRNAIGIGVLLVAACAEPRVGDDVVGTVVVTEDLVRATFGNRAEHRDETIEGACRSWVHHCESRACGFATGLSAGPIRLEGLRQEVTLEYDDRIEGYGYYQDINLYLPEWEVLASAAGDEVDGFALTIGALEPFVEPLLPIELPAFTGAPVTVTWTPSSTADLEAKIELAGHAGFAHAGLDLRFFECVGPDTGSLTIGPVISAELAALGGPGYAELARFHEVAHVTPGYEVRFRIATARAIYFGY